MNDSNFKEDILEKVGDEVETAVIIVFGVGYNEKSIHFPEDKLNIPFNLKEVINYFDYDYDSGFGGQDCDNIFIFLKKKILFIWEYDGSTSIASVPRNPESYNKEEGYL